MVALSAVEEIEGLEGTVIAALGTDGIDGNSKAAGAIVDGNTARAQEEGNLIQTVSLRETTLAPSSGDSETLWSPGLLGQMWGISTS